MKARFRLIIWAAVFLLGATLLPARQMAFSNVDIGETVENMILPRVGGGEEGFLGDVERAHFFLFFRPDQESSLTFLKDVEALRREMKDRSVHWAAIASNRYAPEIVRAAVAKTGYSGPVLLDPGDALFGKLGVPLHPVVGMTDREHRLRVYVHFHKVNFVQIVRAHLRHLLGDIDDLALKNVLEPKRVVQGGDTVVAHRLLKLAGMLLKQGKLDLALVQTDKALQKDTAVVEVWVMRGQILAAKKDSAGAAEAYRKALALDPDNAEAKAGLESAGG